MSRSIGESKNDPFYGEAINIIRTRKKASISYLQRKMKLGFYRASGMIDAMEHDGIITKIKNDGTRDVIAL